METANSLLTNQLLLAILNNLYSLELLLADAFADKTNLRYSSRMLNNDSDMLDTMSSALNEYTKAVKEILENEGKEEEKNEKKD